MKRSALVLLSFLYLFPVIGLTISTHFCAGKITTTSINPFNFGKKCACGKAVPSKCCRDEVKVVQLTEDHRKANEAVITNFSTYHFFLSPAIVEIPVPHLFIPLQNDQFHDPPPGIEQSDLYLLHRVLLI